MALMLALVYSELDSANRAFTTMESLETAGYATILDSLLVKKDEYGSVEMDKEQHPVRHGATAGAVVGGILGLVFLAPVAGAAAGAAIGGMIGKDGGSGHKEFMQFAKKVESEIPNGGGALVLIGETDARDRVIHDLGGYGGKLLSFDISANELAALQKEVDTVAKRSALSPPRTEP